MDSEFKRTQTVCVCLRVFGKGGEALWTIRGGCAFGSEWWTPSGVSWEGEQRPQTHRSASCLRHICDRWERLWIEYETGIQMGLEKSSQLKTTKNEASAGCLLYSVKRTPLVSYGRNVFQVYTLIRWDSPLKFVAQFNVCFLCISACGWTGISFLHSSFGGVTPSWKLR